MPAKKNVKRGKAAAKVETTLAPEDTKQTKNVNEPKTTMPLDTTFTLEKNMNGDKIGSDAVSEVGDDGVVDAVESNGDAPESDIEDADDDEVKASSKKNTKGKKAIKKKTRTEPESEPVAEHDDDEDEVSPKRPLAENSDEENVEQPPAKRGREKAGKKATVSKKARKGKAEPETIANEEDEDGHTSPEEAAENVAEAAPSKRGRVGKTTATTKRARKGKDDAEAEQSEENSTVKTSSSPEKEESPDGMDDDEDEKGANEASQKTKKRGGTRIPKPKVVREAPTRSTRSRKVVTYTEKAEEEEEEAEPEETTNKRAKKPAPPKKAPIQVKKASKDVAKVAASSKKKGRPAKTVQAEDKEDEEVDE